MTNDNENPNPPAETPATVTEPTPEQMQKAVDALRMRVAFFMDELKKLFAPDMLLTFIARSTEDVERYSLLTEEKDNAELIALLARTKKAEPIARPENSGGTN